MIPLCALEDLIRQVCCDFGEGAPAWWVGRSTKGEACGDAGQVPNRTDGHCRRCSGVHSPPVCVTVVKLTNKDGLPRVVPAEGHNIVDEAREAPTEDHLGVLVHVQSRVHGHLVHCEGEGQVLGEALLGDTVSLCIHRHLFHHPQGVHHSPRNPGNG